MPYDLHIVKTRDFIRFDGHGRVIVEKSFDLLANIAKACVERGVHCALIDVRDMYGTMPLTDLYKVAQAFPAMGFSTDDRLAILHKYHAGEGAELFAMFASNRGGTVRAFEDYEEAIDWFSTPSLLDK